jgi:hypothetical protein
VEFTSTSANMARGPIQRDEMPAGDVAFFLSKVQMPTVQHLLSGSLSPIRAAIADISPEAEPQQWIALHMILAAALRLRAPRMPLHERTTACVEAVRAFESALMTCCERKTVRGLRSARIGTGQFSLQTSACASGPDGVQMVVDATSVSVSQGIEMLGSAIRVFTESAQSVDKRTELLAWVVARSNLGCALTMLGQRTHGIEGVQKIDEAIDVLREAAQECKGPELVEQCASIYANLSEAYQALAERAMPGERLRYAERSLDWIAAALGFYAPEEYRWLLELDRAAVA